MSDDRNRSKVAAKRSDWTGEELRRRIYAAGIRPVEFADWSGASTSTIQQYLSEVTPVPMMVQRAVEYLTRCQDLLDQPPFAGRKINRDKIRAKGGAPSAKDAEIERLRRELDLARG